MNILTQVCNKILMVDCVEEGVFCPSDFAISVQQVYPTAVCHAFIIIIIKIKAR